MQEGEVLRVPTIQSLLFLCTLRCRGGGFRLVERNFYAAPATRQESGLALHRNFGLTNALSAGVSAWVTSLLQGYLRYEALVSQ